MKRFAAFVLAAALLAGSPGQARADGIDLKVKGQWDFAFGWISNNAFKDSANRSAAGVGARGGSSDNFQASQRIRTQINFITSEYLQGVLMFEIGMTNWGSNGDDTSGARTAGNTGGALDADGVNVKTKRAYLDWIIPYTEVSVRMGIQGVTLPSTPMGSPLFDADVAGIVVSSPITDWLSVTALWMRPFDAYSNGNSGGGLSGHSLSDEVDVFGLLLPMSFEDLGLNVTPWFMYGFIGANSGIYDYLFVDGGAVGVNSVGVSSAWDGSKGSRTNAWWLGTHLEFTLLDPLVFNLEAIYGYMRKADLSGLSDPDGNVLIDRGTAWENGYSADIGASGWYIGATLDYTLDFESWSMTPGIFGWWASGDKKRSAQDGMLGRMPVLGNDGGSFSPTSFGSFGYYGIGQHDAGLVMGTGTGTWGIGIQFADISFIEDLSHTLRFAYYRGTNDSELVKRGFDRNGNMFNSSGNFYQYTADPMYLTNEDSVFEINFDHQYQIYENLTAVLELGWLHLSTDEDTWRRYRDRSAAAGEWAPSNFKDTDNAWKAQISLRYEF